MATIRSTAHAVPDYEYDQETVREFVRRWLGPKADRFERVLSAFDRGLVDTRRSVIPIEEVFALSSFKEKNDLYIRAAVELGEAAVLRCLDRAGRAPEDVDFFISASCTGFMIPSVDAVLAHRLGMKSNLGRLPITQHGCAGGAVALRQARDHLLAHPGHTVLVLAVEIPSVTMQTNDFSPANIVSSSLFGDGAAAVLLTADGEEGEPRIVAAESYMFPQSADLMGFDLTDTGLKIRLSKQVPAEIREHAPAAIREFLRGRGLTVGDVDHFLLHPGGRKIIEGFEEVFGLEHGELDATREVLRRHGNLSSATVLFILDDYLRNGRGRLEDHGILVAFGPGFGCEALLLHWGVPAVRPADAALPAVETVR